MTATTPLTPDDLAQAIRDYIDDEQRRPSVDRLARRLNRPAAEVQEAATALATAGLLRFDAGLMTLIEHGEPVRPDALPPATVKISPRPKDKPVLLKPTTAAPQEVQEPMPQFADREYDKALVDEYEALAKTGEMHLYATLAKRHDLSEKTYGSRLANARRRLLLEAQGKFHYKTECAAHAKATFVCAACKDSGKTSDGYCDCAIGRKLAETYADAAKQLGVDPNPPAPQPTAAPTATAEPRQGDCTPEQTDAPTSPTTSDSGTIPPGTDLRCVRVPYIEITTPTAEQLPAITADLAGHPPTAEEMEALLTEPAQQGEALRPLVTPLPDQEIEFLREQIKGRDERIAQLESDLAAALDTLAKHAQESKAPTGTLMLLIGEHGEIRLLADHSQFPAADGDEWSEYVRVAGRRRVQVWTCTALYTHKGFDFAVMAPVGAMLRAVPAAETEREEAA